jgi:hypothetical protein
LADPDEAPALDEGAVTEPGDLWVLGNHRLLCGDGTKRAIWNECWMLPPAT